MKKLLILIIFLVFNSCQNSTQFDPELWKPYESGISDKNRKRMVKDLVNNHLLITSTTFKEVVRLIGEPESIDTINGVTKFLIEEKFDENIDPNGYAYLDLYFSKDSILQKWVIVDTEFRP